MLKGLVTQTTRSLGISPICIAQAEVLVFFELMMERKGEDDDDATRVTQEHQLMMIAEIVVANHQSGVNQASQVFLEHEFLSEFSRIGPASGMIFDGVVVGPKRHPFVQSSRSAAQPPAPGSPAGQLHSWGVGSMVQHVETEAIAEVLRPLEGAEVLNPILTIGKLLHE